MPLPTETMNQYIQLGIGGAALLIILIFGFLFFSYIGKQKKIESQGQTSSFDKLISKIDALITSNAEYTGKLNEVLLSNDKDQKHTIDFLKNILEMLLDIQKKVVRIDDRTYSCLRIPNNKEVAADGEDKNSN